VNVLINLWVLQKGELCWQVVQLSASQEEPYSMELIILKSVTANPVTLDLVIGGSLRTR
jgi:hypothetical protein